MKYKRTFAEHMAEVGIRSILIFAAIITLYPFVYVLSMSVSDVDAVMRQEVWLYPVGFNIDSFKMIINSPDVWRAYYNTLWYTVVGTGISLGLTILGAYPLSRKDFSARNTIMIYIVITMLFGGGLIPTFILINDLGLYNTRWAIVLPTAVNAFFIILMRLFFQTSIPYEMTEAAKIDGSNDFGILFKVILPLSTPILAVISLFSAVKYWNDYMSAVLYLPNIDLQPITMLLQKVLMNASTAENLMDPTAALEAGTSLYAYSAQLKYTVVIVTVLPIICVYPFLQKYFVKGIMIGSLKG